MATRCARSGGSENRPPPHIGQVLRALPHVLAAVQLSSFYGAQRLSIAALAAVTVAEMAVTPEMMFTPSCSVP